MVNRHIRMALLFAAAFVSVLLPLAGSAANQPLPPTNLCIGTNCASALTASAGPGIKWHPGVYIWLNPPLTADGWNASQQATWFSQIDEIAADTTIQGVQVIVNWALLEGDTQGDYSGGFAMIDALLAKLSSAAVPKHLMLLVAGAQYGSMWGSGQPTQDQVTELVPLYVYQCGSNCYSASPAGVQWNGSLRLVANIWNSTVEGYLAQLSQAYAARYDTNPYFEMFTPWGETAIGAPTSTGYNNTAVGTQLRALYAASKAAWPHTLMRLAINYFGQDSDTQSLISNVSAGGGVIFGGPDTSMGEGTGPGQRNVQANHVWRGLNGTTPAWNDLRGAYPWLAEVQQLDSQWCSGQACTLAGIWSYGNNTMHNNYWVWVRNTYQGGTAGTATQWAAELSFIRAGSSAVYSTACPSAFGARCNSN